jgi:hypothetical protein
MVMLKRLTLSKAGHEEDGSQGRELGWLDGPTSTGGAKAARSGMGNGNGLGRPVG